MEIKCIGMDQFAAIVIQLVLIAQALQIQIALIAHQMQHYKQIIVVYVITDLIELAINVQLVLTILIGIHLYLNAAHAIIHV